MLWSYQKIYSCVCDTFMARRTWITLVWASIKKWRVEVRIIKQVENIVLSITYQRFKSATLSLLNKKIPHAFCFWVEYRVPDKCSHLEKASKTRWHIEIAYQNTAYQDLERLKFWRRKNLRERSWPPLTAYASRHVC